MKKYPQIGVTLIELLITIGIVAITMSVAVPNMNEFIKNEKLTSTNNAMVASLQFARSEAISKHQQVVVCASKDGKTCSSSNWADGWIVFRDEDLSGSIGNDETVLRARGKAKGKIKISNSSGAKIFYDRRGFAPNSASDISICDDRGAEKAKSTRISNTGRIRRGGNPSC